MQEITERYVCGFRDQNKSCRQNIGTIPTANLPAGVYTLILTVRPSQGDGASGQNYYRWTTYLLIK
jgi:hypothetical protein